MLQNRGDLSIAMLLGIALRQGLKRKPRKGGGFGAQGAAERPEEATARDHEPHQPTPAELQRKARRRAERAGAP